MKLDNVRFVDNTFHDTIYPRCSPELGDLLLTKDGANTGNITLNTLDEPFSLLSSVCLLKPDREKLVPSYLKYYIQSPIGFKEITGKMTGTAINSTDYNTLSGSGTIPVGLSSTTIVLNPIDDSVIEPTETAVLVLQNVITTPINGVGIHGTNNEDTITIQV